MAPDRPHDTDQQVGDPATPTRQALELLSGGIAHDLNNLLHAVRARVSLAARSALDSVAQNHLNEALRYIEDAEALSAQLQTLARGGQPKRARVDLRDLVRRAVSRNVNDARIVCELVLPNEPTHVDVDATQFHQLLSNLVQNALHAMPQGGTLRIAVTQDARGATEAHDVHLTVSDTGQGIAPDILPYIFEPSFTTKASGSGLGLAICQSVARRHGAELRCQSELGRGTTFELSLPSSDWPE